MLGPIALVGGNEFRSDCEAMDRTLLARIGTNPEVVILPTAAARENPSVAAENGIRYFTRLGAHARAAMVVDEETAREPQWVALVKDADLVYLAGGDPAYLRDALRGSPVWKAAVESWRNGRTLAGSSAGAMIMGGKMWFPGGAWGDGLGLLPGLAILPHHAKLAALWDARRMRASLPEEVVMVGIDEATAILGPPWEVVGVGEVSVYRMQEPEKFNTGQFIEILSSDCSPRVSERPARPAR